MTMKSIQSTLQELKYNKWTKNSLCRHPSKGLWHVRCRGTVIDLTRDFISYRLWESSTKLGTSTFGGPEKEYEIYFLAWSLVGSKNVLKNRGRNTALINPPAATFRQQLCSKVVDSSLHSECFGEIIGRFKPAPVYFFFSFSSESIFAHWRLGKDFLNGFQLLWPVIQKKIYEKKSYTSILPSDYAYETQKIPNYV